MNKKSSASRKIGITYIILTVVTVITEKIYRQFGHGVTSPAMTWMFLYPLAGGLFIYVVNRTKVVSVDAERYRSISNLYHSGIATLTVGSFLKGVLEIAGTDSVYLVYFFIVGFAMVLFGGLSLSRASNGVRNRIR
ncbi:hypothetical protein SDC9_116577 [bioreactor metagenome]|uniref:Uncharacterized protein n=1 Tax=bioreactor metagenome TaxID=1076179 RepID=A0A645BW27_9ZZZZ